MGRIENRNLRWIVGFVAACAILLQSLSVAFAFSGGATRMRLDTFGNPICNDLLNHGNDGSGVPPHGKLPAGCAFGSGLSAPFLAGHDAALSAGETIPRVGKVVFRTFFHLHSRIPEHSPGRPRGPPALI